MFSQKNGGRYPPYISQRRAFGKNARLISYDINFRTSQDKAYQTRTALVYHALDGFFQAHAGIIGQF